MTTLTRRQALAGILIVPFASALPKIVSAATPVNWAGWRGDGNNFFRAPVLLTGAEDAILIDGSFNYPAGRALVAEIKATGKRLTTIYVSCNDPDYYFNLKPVVEAFPDARVIAASETVALIKKKADGKLAVWGPKLGENGPQTRDDLVFPAPYDKPTLNLEGTEIDIVTSKTMRDRRYLWVPSLEAVFGGVYVFEGLHLWMADTPSPEERAQWITELDELIARKPKIVVAGHAANVTDTGPDSLTFTRDYLLAYEAEVANANDSGALIAAMKRRYPGLGLGVALEIGAKVAKGEMTWG